MGGGDLNLKKSWHPLTVRNMEKVWKAEQAAEKEKQKLDQLRKEKQQEQAVEELEELQRTSGSKKSKQSKLDWMYSGTHSTANAVQEDYLLGKRKISFRKPDPVAESGLVAKTDLGHSFAKDSDLESKMREDPLIMIRKKENESKSKPKGLVPSSSSSTRRSSLPGKFDNKIKK